MALIRCPECNHEISDTAKFCPNCGYVMKQEDPVQPEPVKEPEKVKVPKPKKEKKKSKIKPWIIIVVVLAVVSIFFVGQWITTSRKNGQWNTVEHLGLKFDVPGYYHLENTSDGHPWYESDPAGFHLYYINGFSFQEGDQDWVIERLNLPWDDQKEVDSVEDTTAHEQTVYTTRYTGKISDEDANGEISILPYANKGTYVFVYLEYPCDKKYEENYHKTLQTIASSGETLPNVQVTLTEDVIFDTLTLKIPDGFEKSDRDSGIRYLDDFSRIDIYSTSFSGLSYDEVRPEIVDRMMNIEDHVNFSNVSNAVYDNRTIHDTEVFVTDASADGPINFREIIVVDLNTSTLYAIELTADSKAVGFKSVFEDITKSITIDQPSSNIKELADGFESFMNKYIDFMVSVKNKNSLSALSEYTQLLAEYSDWMTKIDNVDTSQLSDTDAAYFMEVYARVMGKLASAGLSN